MAVGVYFSHAHPKSKLFFYYELNVCGNFQKATDTTVKGEVLLER